jgi:hypothetical protein
MFRFTIRDVLWLTVVVALALGWWAERRMLFSELHRNDRNWYDLSRAIWESGYEIDPNQKWHLIPRKDKPSSTAGPTANGP